jgi:hypothetical protein
VRDRLHQVASRHPRGGLSRGAPQHMLQGGLVQEDRLEHWRQARRTRHGLRLASRGVMSIRSAEQTLVLQSWSAAPGLREQPRKPTVATIRPRMLDLVLMADSVHAGGHAAAFASRVPRTGHVFFLAATARLMSAATGEGSSPSTMSLAYFSSARVITSVCSGWWTSQNTHSPSL